MPARIAIAPLRERATAILTGLGLLATSYAKGTCGAGEAKEGKEACEVVEA